jgi:hypothetical protein
MVIVVPSADFSQVPLTLEPAEMLASEAAAPVESVMTDEELTVKVRLLMVTVPAPASTAVTFPEKCV